ncbi:MAG TPA: 50S ribosomal protein L21 [Solirubrobacterales bacterium]|jgi:large subunit ribosomal protein L21|nr:50S ribosomal protein L21 [Solirubrobacterales bacterium]
MYAVVRVGGKQYRVEKGQSLVVDRISASEGDKLTLDPLLFADGRNTVFEGGELGKVKVEAVVSGHERGPKLHVLKFKPKKGYKRRTGHRSELTRLEIKDIKLLQRASTAAKQDKEAGEAPRAGAKRASRPRTAAKTTTAQAKPRSSKPRTTKKEAEDGS